MIKYFIYILSLLFLITTNLEARTYKDKGLYGNLSYLYQVDDTTNDRYTSKKTQLTQEYTMGYLGNVYSPRLLDYKLETTLKFDDVKNEYNTQDTTVRTNSYDYNLNFQFIKDTMIPFRVYFYKQTRPISYLGVDTNRSLDSVYESKTRGISGSINFSRLKFNYGAEVKKSTTDFIDKRYVTDTNSYKASMLYSTKSQNINISYRNLDQQYNSHIDENLTYELYEEQLDMSTESVDLLYIWKISKALHFDANANYEDSKYYSTKTTSARANLRYSPKSDYSGYINASVSSMEYTNNSDFAQNNKFDTLNVSEGMRYRLTEHFSVSESFSSYSFKAYDYEGNNFNGVLSSNYNYGTIILSDVFFNFTNSVSVQRNDATVEYIEDGNTTHTVNDILNVSLSAYLKEELPSINSRLDFSNSLYFMQDTLDTKRDNFNSIVALNSNFLYVMQNNLSFSYLLANSSNRYADEIVDSSVTTIILKDYISGSARLGIKGNVFLKLGANYTNTNNNGTNTTRLFPSADMNINYRFFRKLFFTSSFHMDKDIINDIMNYKALAEFKYKAGKTTMSLGYKYDNTQYNNIVVSTLERSTVLARFTRRF